MKIKFKVLPDEQGTYTLIGSYDGKLWTPIKWELTLTEVMEVQACITNSNILNHLNLLSILKNQ
jgi:hypothetical protein